MTAEQIADLIRDDAWRASSQRLDDALGWRARRSQRFGRGSRVGRPGGPQRPAGPSEA